VDAATAIRRVADGGACLSEPPAVALGGRGPRRRCEGDDEVEEQRMRCLASVAMAELGGVVQLASDGVIDPGVSP
jgi:hypothetical protein